MTREIIVKLSNPSTNNSKLEHIKIIVTILATVAIPIMVFFVGQSIEQSLKNREVSAKYLEISVGILSKSPSEETRNLREWAIENIKKFSDVPLGQAGVQELQTEALPVSAAPIRQQNYTIPAEPRIIKYVVITDSEFASLAEVKSFAASSNANASYHYVIDVNGAVIKLVEEENIAWHAGQSEWKGDTSLNPISIGIGLVHLSSKDGKNWRNLPANHPAVGPNYPPEQISALIGLLTTILQKHSLQADAIITKQDIAPTRRRTDLAGGQIEAIRSRVKASVDGN